MELLIGKRQLPIQIDEEDFERVNSLKGCLSVTSHGYVSLSTHVGKSKYKREYLHRILTNAPSGFFVDHINHDTRDNRSSNLRIVSPAQSICNTKQRKGKYKGVFFSKQNSNWCVQVNHKHIGTFETEDEAALAYNEAAKRIQGQYAYQNII